MNEYLKAQMKTNSAIINSSFSLDELHRFSKSDYRWADNRSKNFQLYKVKKGEIYQFEFGKNFIPEMSYEHRGLVIGINKKLLYVLPIFSYNSQRHTNVYHPIDFPNSKSDIYLLKKSEFSFINHDSVLKLNDIRTVSVNRILYKHNGKIDLSSNTYKQITFLVFQKYFPDFCYDFKQYMKTISLLQNKITELENIQNTLKTENQQLLSELQNSSLNSTHTLG